MNYFWLLFTLGVLVVFVATLSYRLLAVARLPVHLRWEIEPIPRSAIGYMAKEILFMRSVWSGRRLLWPFALSLHLGIYIAVTAMLMTGFGLDWGFLSLLSFTGCLCGLSGTSGLILLRLFDGRLRSLSSTSTYLNLVLLWAIFASGVYAWVSSTDFASDARVFLAGIRTLDPSVEAVYPLSAHFFLVLVFLLYLPFTNMTHFATKYFMYHRVRWDNRPRDPGMERAVGRLLNLPATWSAGHAGSEGSGRNRQDTPGERNG